jgi:hypothetical protein
VDEEDPLYASMLAGLLNDRLIIYDPPVHKILADALQIAQRRRKRGPPA